MIDKVGIIIGAYDNTADNIGRLARSLKDAGYYVIVGYDASQMLPDAEAVNSCDYFFSGGGHKNKQDGHLWAIQVGLGLLCDARCNHVLSVTGDVTVENPEKINDLIGVLGRNQVMASQWHGEVGTMLFFGHTWPLYRAFSEIHKGPPQLEKKFHYILTIRNIPHVVCPCKKEDLGKWELIGYKRGNDNYPP